MPVTTTVVTTPNLAIEQITVGATGQEPKILAANSTLEVFAQLHVKSRTQTSAPGSPAEGDAYIVPPGASGYGSASTHDVAVSINSAWVAKTPQEGHRAFVEDEDIPVFFDPTDKWLEETTQIGSIASSLTASTTQTQGQLPLTKRVNIVTTVANTNDAATLPAARTGRVCEVFNLGANTLQLFPASGDAIDSGSANASTTVAAGARVRFIAKDATTWLSFKGA